MMLNFVYLIVFFINLTTAQECYTKRQATYYGDEFICNSINELPKNKNQGHSFICYNCNISVLDDNIGTFDGYKFNISYSHVKTVKEGAFKNFTDSVKLINLDHNQIETIGSSAFYTTNKTSWYLLDLSNNKLKNLNSKQFVGVSVEMLDLSQNQLVDISIFDGLEVSVLNLANNLIEDVPVDVFSNMQIRTARESVYYYNSKSIVLTSNRIRKIEKGSFRVKGNLRRIILNNNEITIVKNNTFENMTINILDFSKNKISTLENKALYGLRKLEVLYLQENLIETISNDLFSGLISLKVLRLDANRIKKLSLTTFWSATKITSLNLSGNYLEDLSPNHLVPLLDLHTLSLSNNRLTTFDLKTILSNHMFITEVYLDGNYWYCSELVKNYKLLHEKTYGNLKTKTKYFDVPNLHGIPCSRKPVSLTPSYNFSEFLKDLSMDTDLEYLYDIEPDLDPIEIITPYVNGIYYMIIILSVLKFITWTLTVVQKVFVNENKIRSYL